MLRQLPNRRVCRVVAGIGSAAIRWSGKVSNSPDWYRSQGPVGSGTQQSAPQCKGSNSSRRDGRVRTGMDGQGSHAKRWHGGVLIAVGRSGSNGRLRKGTDSKAMEGIAKVIDQRGKQND